jgi:hypothetical protein
MWRIQRYAITGDVRAAFHIILQATVNEECEKILTRSQDITIIFNDWIAVKFQSNHLKITNLNQILTIDMLS